MFFVVIVRMMFKPRSNCMPIFHKFALANCWTATRKLV